MKRMTCLGTAAANDSNCAQLLVIIIVIVTIKK